ncbi:hypothetical protein AB0H73_31990 [Streptomyces olivoreticuli]|uniref:hypothetical protein n=1 Tax=Streptomyces olivoreticuli TaxID=68246 RepID=UPI0013C367A1|nr:hypothetical protein [Streptomyces olivoreticuli]
MYDPRHIEQLVLDTVIPGKRVRDSGEYAARLPECAVRHSKGKVADRPLVRSVGREVSALQRHYAVPQFVNFATQLVDFLPQLFDSCLGGVRSGEARRVWRQEGA